jgi:hypothetical protein
MKSQRMVLVLVGLTGLLSGCTGEVRMKVWTQPALMEALQKEGIQGVIGYYPKAVIEISELIQYVDKDGKVVPGIVCKRVSIQKVVTVTDYDHPYQVYYVKGVLEANKFGVQLNNGIIAAVNTESTPDQGKTIANLGEAAGSFAKIAAGPAAPVPIPPGAPDCNGTPTFVRYEALPKLP